MFKLKLFQQDPRQEKFEVDSSIRTIESIDMDRKEDLVKFKGFMQDVSAEKSDLPDKQELDKLHDEATKARGTSLGILGIVAAIGAGGLGFHFLGGFGGISKLVSDAMSFITGGGVKTSTGKGDNILGLSGAEVKSLTPTLPDLSGPSTALSPQTKTQLPSITPYNEPPVPGKPFNPNESPRKSTTEPPDVTPAPQPQVTTNNTSGSQQPSAEPAAQPLRGSSESRPSIIDQSTLPPLPPTGTGQYADAQQYGASRDGGNRRHAGQDFDAGPNDTFYSRIGGEVTLVYGGGGGGYGNYVDIYNEQLGVTERIAEGDKNLVSLGDVIAAGTPVQQGTAQTGVFHYEIRDGRAETYGFAGTRDPVAFLNNLPSDLARVTPAPGQTPSSPALPNTPQQRQPNIIERLTKMLEPYTSQVTGQLGQVFEAFKYMQDKELMENTILYRDVLSGKVKLPINKEEEVEPPKLEYGLESILEMIEPTSKDTEVSMLSPEAEQALSGMVILNNQGMVQGGGGASPGGASLPPENTAIGAAETPVMILGGSFNVRDLHKKQMYKKLGAR